MHNCLSRHTTTIILLIIMPISMGSMVSYLCEYSSYVPISLVVNGQPSTNAKLVILLGSWWFKCGQT